MSGKTSTQSKSKYNAANYKQYLLRIRKGSELYDEIEKFKTAKGSSLNYLIIKLLSEYFDVGLPGPQDTLE